MSKRLKMNGVKLYCAECGIKTTTLNNAYRTHCSRCDSELMVKFKDLHKLEPSKILQELFTDLKSLNYGLDASTVFSWGEQHTFNNPFKPFVELELTYNPKRELLVVVKHKFYDKVYIRDFVSYSNANAFEIIDFIKVSVEQLLRYNSAKLLLLFEEFAKQNVSILKVLPYKPDEELADDVVAFSFVISSVSKNNVVIAYLMSDGILKLEYLEDTNNTVNIVIVGDKKEHTCSYAAARILKDLNVGVCK